MIRTAAAAILLVGCSSGSRSVDEDPEAPAARESMAWRYDETRRVAIYGPADGEILRVACDRVSAAGRPMIYISRLGGRAAPGAAALRISSNVDDGVLQVRSTESGSRSPLSWWGYTAPDSPSARAFEGASITLSFGARDALELPGGDAPRRAVAVCR